MVTTQKRPRATRIAGAMAQESDLPMHDEAYIRIPLRARDGSIRAHALVDCDDAPIAALTWSLQSMGYAQRGVGPKSNRRILLLHRVLLGLDFGDKRQVDHINGDKLDCRRANMRVVTAAENTQNVRTTHGSSRYRGVSWNTRLRKWAAYCKVEGHKRHLGYFACEMEAAETASAYRSAYMTHTNEARCGPHAEAGGS